MLLILSAAGDCGSYFAFGGHCYLYRYETMTYAQANASCQDDGAYLVEIGSLQEQFFVEGRNHLKLDSDANSIYCQIKGFNIKVKFALL